MNTTTRRHWFSLVTLPALLFVGCVGAGEGPVETTESASHEGVTPDLTGLMNECLAGPCEVRIVNEATGRCVALDASNRLETQDCSGASGQTFVIGSTRRAFWSFNLAGIEHQESGQCLTYSPNAPQASDCSGSAAQAWSFVTGGHDEWIELEATNGHSQHPERSDYLLRDDPASHRVVSTSRGTTIDTRARWTFVSTASQPEEEEDVLSLSGTVTQNQEVRRETATLEPGTYTFTMSGTNDADLYVRIGSAPTVRTYACRPYRPTSDEQCVVTLSSSAVVHAMVRGYAASSTFELVGTR